MKIPQLRVETNKFYICQYVLTIPISIFDKMHASQAFAIISIFCQHAGQASVGQVVGYSENMNKVTNEKHPLAL